MRLKNANRIIAYLCLFLILLLNSNALKSESQNYKSISIVISGGGDTVESQNYRNLASIGIVSGQSSSQNYINNLGFAQTILLANGQPCTAASQCEGGFCCSNLCQSSACPTPSPEPSGGAAAAGGGGGGGGGGGITLPPKEQEDFTVNPSSLQFQLVLGESSSKTIQIQNTGTKESQFSIELAGESQFIGLSANSFSLAPGEQKAVTITAAGNKLGTYIGEIVIKLGSMEKTLSFVLEVESTEVLFDVKLDILSDYKQVKPGGTLRMQVTLINIGAKENVDVIVTYLIKDKKGGIMHESSESFAVEQQKSYLKEIKIPKSAQFGDYIAIAELRYANSFAVSSELFSVVEEITPIAGAKQAGALSRLYYMLIGISSMVILVLYIISRIISKRREEW